MRDNGIEHYIIGNDRGRGLGGRPTNKENECQMKGIVLRNMLHDVLANHNMSRPELE